MKKMQQSPGTYAHFQPSMLSDLFVLKHKDLDVAMVQMDCHSGKIEYVLEVYLPDELPVGCTKDNQTIQAWWESRAIPDTRRGIQQILHYLNENSTLSLMLSAYGLSLTDHYWLQPIDEELYWKDLNFYENDFSDELGNLLSDSEKINVDSHISKFSPSSSVNGEMKKKWIIRQGIRYLLKINTNDYGQQSVNEWIASRLHDHLGWKNHVSYQLETARINNSIIPCSLNRLFTSQKLEFVSAYQLIRNHKLSNDHSSYETLIELGCSYGLSEQEIRTHLEYTILTDFILSNTDRHFNNFGFLYDPELHKFVSMAPIFDSGNSLFYNSDIIPSGNNLLDINVASFCRKEVNLLRYVTNKNLITLSTLKDFSNEAEEILQKYTSMPTERAHRIAKTIDEKLEYLKLFQQNKKIWKQEKYW